MDEHELQALLSFATGEGRGAWTGPYMHTYPGRTDDVDDGHDGCVELERRGLLKRHIDEPGHVCWVRADREVG